MADLCSPRLPLAGEICHAAIHGGSVAVQISPPPHRFTTDRGGGGSDLSLGYMVLRDGLHASYSLQGLYRTPTSAHLAVTVQALCLKTLYGKLCCGLFAAIFNAATCSRIHLHGYDDRCNRVISGAVSRAIGACHSRWFVHSAGSVARVVVAYGVEVTVIQEGLQFVNYMFNEVEIANAYEINGVACLSVLTDEKYFKGSFENLEAICKAGVKCPLLCKEFIIDEWKIYYARTKGVDAILLIVAVLPDNDFKRLTEICRMLDLAILVEVHNEREMDRVLSIDGIRMIGINNRNLGDLVNVRVVHNLMWLIAEGFEEDDEGADGQLRSFVVHTSNFVHNFTNIRAVARYFG